MIKLAFIFAWRELRGILRGEIKRFQIFLACLALGVGAISGVNAVALAITAGLENEGATILGGDVAFTLVQRRINETEKNFLQKAGRVNETASLRSMLRTADTQNLIELKAVGKNWPHKNSGEFLTEPKQAANEMKAGGGIVVAKILLERLEKQIGDVVNIGKGEYKILGTIENEPDRLSENFAIAPRVIMSLENFEKTKLNQQGAIIYWTARLALFENSNESLQQFLGLARENFHQSGWRVRTRENASPSLQQNVERFARFLTLVGLATLIVGGVGIANAVRAFLENKRGVIAVLKSLGGSARFIFAVYLLQIIFLSLLGIVIGLCVGVSLPFLAKLFLQNLVPFHLSNSLNVEFFASSFAFGLLVVLSFALWPLGQTRFISARHLFAGRVGKRKVPPFIYIFFTGLALAGLALLAISQSASQFVASVFLVGLAIGFVVLHFLANFVKWLARQIKNKKFNFAIRLAISNLHRPASLTNDVILSLGLGLALLVALALVDVNLRRQITNELPKDAPQFFFLDIQKDEIESFQKNIGELSNGELEIVPMLRGRIISLNGILAEDYKVEQGGEWILREDRGLTYANDIPKGSTLAAGEWWQKNHSGEILVSFAFEEAQELGLQVGDRVEVNVLGKNITARIANLRHIEWESLAINFVMIFSPNALAGAPHTFLATLKSGGTPTTIANKIGKIFPTITIVRVDDTIAIISNLVRQFGVAIRVCAFLALLASCLVLAGSTAAGAQARIHSAVVLKVLGGRRRIVVSSFIFEYIILGFVSAIFACLCGGIVAWFMVEFLLEGDFIFSWGLVLGVVVVALICTIGFGLREVFSVLGYRASGILREL